MQVRIKSQDRMSNRQFHAANKPFWWVRIGQGDNASFVRIERVRGDECLDVTAEVPAGTQKLFIGCGPNNSYGIRETFHVDPEDQPGVTADHQPAPSPEQFLAPTQTELRPMTAQEAAVHVLGNIPEQILGALNAHPKGREASKKLRAALALLDDVAAEEEAA